MLFWAEDKSGHDRAISTVKSFLKKKHGVKFDENVSVGAGRRPDLSSKDEGKRMWYLCEIKDKRGDLQRALDQLDHNRSFLEKKYRSCKVVCYLAITKALHDDMSTSQVGKFKEWQARMKRQKIKILVASRSTVKPV